MSQPIRCFKSLFILLVLTSATFAQGDSIYHKKIVQRGNTMTNLFLIKNYTEFVKYTYKPLIDLAGGENKIIELTKTGISKIEEEGFTIIGCFIQSQAPIFQYANELQSVVTQILEIKTPKGKLISKSSLIATSPDNGENWYFLDTQGKELSQIKKIFPNLSDSLVIPIKEKPMLIEE